MVSAAIWQGLPAWCRAGALAVAVLGLVGGRSSASESGAATQAVPVRVAAVTSDVRAQALHFAGVARARQRASLTFQVGGTLATRPLEIGQQVVAGQVLATLYNPQLEPARDAARARLAELQAQSAQARRDAQRTEQLFERGVLSQADQEQQRARLQALAADQAFVAELQRVLNGGSLAAEVLWLELDRSGAQQRFGDGPVDGQEQLGGRRTPDHIDSAIPSKIMFGMTNAMGDGLSV